MHPHPKLLYSIVTVLGEDNGEIGPLAKPGFYNERVELSLQFQNL